MSNKMKYITLHRLSEYFVELYQEEGMISLLFSLASRYQNIISKELNFFPILWIYGERATGKTSLAQFTSLVNQEEIIKKYHINASTSKQIIKPFVNNNKKTIVLDEYNDLNTNQKHLLKGIWDRSVYKTFDQKIDKIIDMPIISSALVTSNKTPDDISIIHRCILIELQNSGFNESEFFEFVDLVLNINKPLIKSKEKQIEFVKSNFFENYISFKKEFTKTINERYLSNRMICNLSVLGAVYNLFRDHLCFTKQDLLDEFYFIIHHQESIVRQINKNIIN